MQTLSHDTRPRFRYRLPDGQMIRVIGDHGERPAPMISYELRAGDTLWNLAQPIRGARRIVWAQLAEGM